LRFARSGAEHWMNALLGATREKFNFHGFRGIGDFAWGSPGSRLFDKLFTSPNNIFDPRSVAAHEIYRQSMFALGVTGAIFLTVSTVLVYALIRYRQRPDDDAREPAQIYGSNQIELSWTVIPVLIVIVLFLTTARLIYTVQHAPEPKGALNVGVVGHQFWWEFRYPGYGFVTANELHVPVSPDANHPKQTFLQLTTADVNHGFWVPRLGGKTDLVANQINKMWIAPDEVGLFTGQCAQYCGVQHANMLLRVYSDSPADFQKWVHNQEQPAVQDPSVDAGRAVFESNSCINCHSIRGTAAHGTFGPDLTHLMSRDTIGSGVVPNNRANLEKWIQDPATIKPGCLMPAMKLSSHDVDEITSYLLTLH